MGENINYHFDYKSTSPNDFPRYDTKLFQSQDMLWTLGNVYYTFITINFKPTQNLNDVTNGFQSADQIKPFNYLL